MSAKKLEFFFDFASPYSYIASHQIEAVAEKHGTELVWQPFVLGGVFQAIGANAPRDNKPKGEYLLQDLEDLTALYGIPYKQRTEFIIRSILPLRATLQIPQGQERARAVHALYKGSWAEDQDMSKAEVVVGLLTDAGFDGAALVEGTQQPAVKDELRKNTEDIVSRGGFGAPTYFVDDSKMFWGHDRLDVLDRYLENMQTG